MRPPTSSEVTSGKRQKKAQDKCKHKAWFIIIQLLLWGFIAGLTCFIIFSDDWRSYRSISFLIACLAISYLVSIFLNLNSVEWKCLSNVKNAQQAIDIIQKQFCNELKINFSATCWHWKFVFSGNTMQQVPEISLQTDEELDYYSGRDISGYFSLNTYKVTESPWKSMLKLRLIIEYEFADEESSLDYTKQKDSFIARYRNKDDQMDFVEERIIEGFDEYSLISTEEKTPLTINRFVFILFLVFIPVIELYKIYINIRWAAQTFTIRKVISNRIDLTQNEFVEKYSLNKPKLAFKGEVKTFENAHYKKQRISALHVGYQIIPASTENQIIPAPTENQIIPVSNENNINSKPAENPINTLSADNQMLLNKISKFDINPSEVTNQDQMPAPQQIDLNPEMPQVPLQMQGALCDTNVISLQSQK